jgi:rifampin ADP-ribosylating transferase
MLPVIHAGAATKKFPGNQTRSYRSMEPLRIVGEVADWISLSPEALQVWRDRLAAILAEVRGEINRLIEELQN